MLIDNNLLDDVRSLGDAATDTAVNLDRLPLHPTAGRPEVSDAPARREALAASLRLLAELAAEVGPKARAAADHLSPER